MRENGKRSFQIIPAHILAGETPGNVRSLVIYQWLCRRYSGDERPIAGLSASWPDAWKPALADGFAIPLVTRFFGMLATSPKMAALAATRIGYAGLEQPITVHNRLPPRESCFNWLANLRGVRLKVSPNDSHPGAVWLRRATFWLNEEASRWTVNITYSYRHNDSGWAIGLQQDPGEKLEVFADRLWHWFEPQVQWRHPEAWYHRFLCTAEHMKRGEMEHCHRPETEMMKAKDAWRTLFTTGFRAPGYWENELAEPLVVDAHDQYRVFKQIEMSSARLRTVKRWIRQDRAAKAATA